MNRFQGLLSYTRNQILNMNRLAIDSDTMSMSKTPVEFEQSHDVSTLLRRRSNSVADLPLATFAPLHYEPNYAYPLIVWLHGTASNEHELRQIMPLVSMRNYVAVAPRGTWTDPRHRGRYGWRQASETIDEAESCIAECLTLAQKRFHVHSNRVFLAGHGSGATMALRVAWRDPARFAGVIAINGPLPMRLSPMRRVNELRRVPCFLATSRDSRTYPATRVCRDLRLLHSAGCTVALRQYPGDDGLTSNMLSDLDRWIMELVCGGASNS